MIVATKRTRTFTRVCAVCGREFQALTTAAKYCSKAHSQKARDARRNHLPGARCGNCHTKDSQVFRPMTLFGSDTVVVLCQNCFPKFARQQRWEMGFCFGLERGLPD